MVQLSAHHPNARVQPRCRRRVVALALSGAAVLAGCSTTPPPPQPTAAPSAPAPVPRAAELDATNTGWQHTGVQLKTMDCGPNGSVTIERNGAVLDGYRIPCSVTVLANDVTISRSEITSTGDWGIRKADQFTNLTVVDTEVIGNARCAVGVGFSGVRMNRLNVHGCSDGVHPETGSTLENSWIHDLATQPGPDGSEPHNDGVQTTGGSDIVIRNNKVDNPHRQTSAILIGGEFGAPSNITIEDNYLDGGNFTIYLDPAGTNRIIRDNTFTTNYVYGPANVKGAVDWTGNVFTDGSPVSR